MPELHSLFLSERDKHPMVGRGVNRHAIASGLWNRHHQCPEYPPSPDANAAGRRYFHLQSQVLCAYIESRHRLSTLDEYEKYALEPERPIAPMLTYSAGLALRDLSRPDFDRLVAQLPLTASTQQYARQLALISLDSSKLGLAESAIGQQRIESIKKFFSAFTRVMQGYKPSQSLRRGWGGGGGSGLRRHGFLHSKENLGIFFEDLALGSTAEDLPPIGIQGVFTDVNYAKNENQSARARELERSGIAPEEDLERILQLYTPEQLKGRLSQLKLRQRAMESSAQALPFADSQLTPAELRRINTLANQVISTADFGVSNNDQRIYQLGALLSRAMLCLGQPLTAACSLNCVVVAQGCDLPIAPTSDQITMVLVSQSNTDFTEAHVRGFVLPGIMPDYISRLPDELESIDRPHADYFEVPDLLGLGPQLLQFLIGTQAQDFGHFGLQLKTANMAVSVFLKTFADPRITPQRVAKTLASYIKFQSGNQSLAWVVTADKSNAGQARMHYTRYPINTLLLAHQKACRRLARNIGQIVSTPRILAAQDLSQSIGARFVIDLRALVQLISGLQETLSRPLLASSTPAEIREYHQFYLLYTLLYQSTLTSVRAAIAPDALYAAWLCASEPNSDIAVALEDKSITLGSRSRLIVITGELAQQYANFKTHLFHLHRLLPRLRRNADFPNTEPPFFSLGIALKFEVVTPSWISSFLSAFTGYEIPANFNRAFLRTELLGRGCSEEVVDAYLGHANMGESPYSALSTFDYGSFTTNVTLALRDLQDELTLRPIKSSLAAILKAGP